MRRARSTPYPDQSKCRLVGGDPCPITPNEIKQLLASGTVGGVPQADDVDFAGAPAGSANEPSCSPAPLPDCTGPYGPGDALRAQVNANRQVFGAPVPSTSYPARRGFDQFYGYGRANMNRAVKAVVDDPSAPSAAELPPEADITSPGWFAEIDPSQPSVDVSGTVFARGEPYRCRVYVAPGQYPNNATTTDSPPGDFAPLSNGWCDGATVHGGADAAAAHDGVLGSIDVSVLRQRFPAATDFSGPIPTAAAATGNGRPFFAPHAFTFKVVVSTTAGTPRTGEDQRSAWLHRDGDLLDGFPRTIGAGGSVGGPDATPTTDGASSPAFADLDGDNRNELIFADSDGFVHAIGTGGAELPGWPVRGDEPGFVAAHDTSPAYSDGVGSDLGGAFLAAVAVGDADDDGIPEVYAADVEGKVYGWAPDGGRVFTEQSNPDWSGRPLVPFENVRSGKTNRTQHGFFGAPVLADLDGDGHDEVIAASMDRHVYAWKAEDSDPGAPGGAADSPGYPVLVVDPGKVASVDPQTHAVTFAGGSGSFMQGAIIDTPAVGDITGDGVPEVVVGTNEEYDEDLNLGNPGGLGLLIGAGLVDPGNSRVYALAADGGGDSDPLPGDALVPGWPFDAGMLLTETLPIVGEGVAGPPVIGPVSCPDGDGGSKVGTATAAGPAYVLNGDGTSCYGDTSGKANALSADFGGAAHATDTPLIPALGNPAFGAAGGASTEAPGLAMGAIGLFKALDLQVVDYQSGQDVLGVWDPATGQFRSGFPATVNDLQLLTGPAVADVDGAAGEEILSGSSSQDLVAYGPQGTPASGWPKLTTDWTVATPLIGTFGTVDTEAGSEKVVVGITRSGYIHAYGTDAPACSPSSSPRFHHDNANSGDYSRDAALPGAPAELKSKQGDLSFRAPGDDLLCGTVDHYELVTAKRAIDEQSFADAKPLAGAPNPKAAGGRQTLEVPAGSKGFVAIRAVDEQGNVGRVATIRAKPHRAHRKRCSNVIRGSSRADRLRGAAGGDRIEGRAGRDRIDGRAGRDCVRGGKQADRLVGGAGRDRINGGDGADRILAADGNKDRIRCGAGVDRVIADRKDRVNARCEKVELSNR